MTTIKENERRIMALEKDMKLVKYLLIYVAGVLSVQFGAQELPKLAGLIFGLW